MSNSFFQFKQFIVHQKKCAMKVSTDACLLGALVDENLLLENILDIGSGTGVLSLMMAQKFSSAKIDAVEIEEKAFQQTLENFSASPWKDRLQSHFSSIQNFAKENPNKKFDLIISNPPFFENDLLSPNKNVNTAKHSTELSLKELIDCSFELLNENGLIYLVLPIRRKQEIIQHCSQIIYLHDKPESVAKRCVYVLQKKISKKIVGEELILKNKNGEYSIAFKKLMQPFYLKL
jgi:tRNA1Val (adenine37-N6)-methyltransferase